MNRKALILPVTVLAALAMTNCGKKQQQEEIIVEKIVEKPQTEVKTITRPTQSDNIKWIEGNTYSYSISYAAQDSLPAIENYGDMYRDNAITISIKRSDGSEVCEKLVTKNSFSGLLSDDMRRHGLLISMVYDKCDSNSLYFVASIGSPDENNEDFVLMQYIIDRFGNTKVATYTAPVI